MKKSIFLFALSVLLLGFANRTAAQTTYTIDNQTNCDIEIRVDCYNNNCQLISSVGWDIAANHIGMLDDCVGSAHDIFTVNWIDPNCQVAPVTVEDMSLCGGFPSTDMLQTNCPNCTNGGPATVTISGTTLTITP